MWDEGVDMDSSGSNVIRFYFDPICPWTWKTAQWLKNASLQRDFAIQWFPFSLAMLNGIDVADVPGDLYGVSRAISRVVAKLAVEENFTLSEEFYFKLGQRWHEEKNAPSLEDAEVALKHLHLEAYAEVLWDSVMDDKVRIFHAYAHSLAGDGTGSPVLEVTKGVGVYGPIITNVVEGKEAGDLFDYVAGLTKVGSFSELKRGR